MPPGRTIECQGGEFLPDPVKMEEVCIKDYRRFEEAGENIAEFIEEVYNKKRLHSL